MSASALGLQALFGDIMRRHGARCTAEEFHRAVNVTFHEFESEEYDREHRSMWESLPAQFSLLVNDCLPRLPETPDGIRLLDIGCGTGLASDSLVKSAIGAKLRSVTLLDTSPAMLRQASKRAGSWGLPFEAREGTVESLPSESRFEWIVTCSVLHHVPDLASFLTAVRKLQTPGGIFLHLQDPNGDSFEAAGLRARTAELAKMRPGRLGRLSPRRILGRLKRELTGTQGQDCVSRTNRALVEKGVIASPLTVKELYSITDVHVYDGHGISIQQLSPWLPDYACISQRSYAFFGPLASELPAAFRNREEELVAARALNGVHIGAAWQLTPENVRTT